MLCCNQHQGNEDSICVVRFSCMNKDSCDAAGGGNQSSSTEPAIDHRNQTTVGMAHGICLSARSAADRAVCGTGHDGLCGTDEVCMRPLLAEHQLLFKVCASYSDGLPQLKGLLGSDLCFAFLL